MGKQGRLGLGLWDRLVLFVAWVVTCGLVYLLGFYVGKGTEVRTGVPDRVVQLPVTSKPPPEGQRPKGESELTFYDRLATGERGESPAPSPPPRTPPPADKPVAAPSPPAHPPVATAPAPPARPSGAAPAPPTAVAKAPAPAPARPPTPTSVSPTAGTPPPAATAPAPPRSGSGGWTVLASPTRSRAEADDLQRQLRGKGYEATVVRVARDGDTWYRVQIGRFGSAAQASEVVQRLRERDGVSHVFVASE
jgi:hypothetical protein